MIRLHISIATILSLGLATAACDDTLSSTWSSVDRTPDVSELGIRVEAAALDTITAGVLSRPDAACRNAEPAMHICLVNRGSEAMVFTRAGHAGHPAALFRGLMGRDGRVVFEERGWYAGSEASASGFYTEAAGLMPVLIFAPPANDQLSLLAE